MAVFDKRGLLHGSVSNIVYRSYGDKQIAQIKRSKIRQTLSTKESGLEFGLCSATARVIRHTFNVVYQGYDGGMINRLNAAVRKSVMACSHKTPGQRDIHDADLSYLKGFQFNLHSPMEKTLKIKPEVSLSPENKVRINLPAISRKDINGPSAGYYILRCMAVSFDFKKEVFCYTGYKEIRISDKLSFEGGEIELDEAMPKGRLAMLSMSLHAYRENQFGGVDSFNSDNWSPAELLDAWHIPAEEMPENGMAMQESNPAGYQFWPMVYRGQLILQKFKDLRKKTGPGKIPPKTVVAKRDPFQLPKGDQRFKG